MKSSSVFRFPGAVASWRCPASISTHLEIGFHSGNCVREFQNPARDCASVQFPKSIHAAYLNRINPSVHVRVSRIQGEHFLIQPLYHQLRNRPYVISPFSGCRKSEWVQGAERYLFSGRYSTLCSPNSPAPPPSLKIPPLPFTACWVYWKPLLTSRHI